MAPRPKIVCFFPVVLSFYFSGYFHSCRCWPHALIDCMGIKRDASQASVQRRWLSAHLSGCEDGCSMRQAEGRRRKAKAMRGLPSLGCEQVEVMDGQRRQTDSGGPNLQQTSLRAHLLMPLALP